MPGSYSEKVEMNVNIFFSTSFYNFTVEVLVLFEFFGFGSFHFPLALTLNNVWY